MYQVEKGICTILDMRRCNDGWRMHALIYQRKPKRKHRENDGTPVGDLVTDFQASSR